MKQSHLKSATFVLVPTNLLLLGPSFLHSYFFFPTFLLDSPYNLTLFSRSSYIFTTFSNPAPFLIPFPPISHSSIPVPNNQKRPPSPLSATSSHPYIFTSSIPAPLHSYYIYHPHRSSRVARRAVNPTSAIPRLGPMCRHSRHTSPTAPQTQPVVPGERPTLSAFSPFPTVRDCSAAAHPHAGQPEMSPSGTISARPALQKRDRSPA